MNFWIGKDVTSSGVNLWLFCNTSWTTKVNKLQKIYIFPQAKARCKIEIDTILCTGLVLVFYFCDRGFCFVRVGWEILFRMYYCVYTKPCGRLLGLGNANCRPCIIFSLPCLSMLFYLLSDHIFHAKTLKNFEKKFFKKSTSTKSYYL